jgi:predicted Rossmann fold nucleotide-binding protein DprA/Smf involved in DNA uptake
MRNALSKDTQAVLLLCGRFSPREDAQPLDLREYNRVVDFLHRQNLRPAFLFDPAVFDLDWPVSGIELSRLRSLLGRGMALGLATERWINGGRWVVSRSDEDYPVRLRLHLGRSAPPLLWSVGDLRLLQNGGIAVVGSREIDEDAVRWAEQLTIGCVASGLTIISGGARGTDQVALASALLAGGSAVGVLPEGLGRPSVVSRYREAIVDGRLVLISPFYPDAGFNVGNAMARNKVIYGLADAAVIIRADAHKGGTWAGAEEELRRDNRIPLFVRAAEPVEEGNRALLAIGGRALTDASRGDLKEYLTGVREELFSVLSDVASPASPPMPSASVGPVAAEGELPEHPSGEAGASATGETLPAAASSGSDGLPVSAPHSVFEAVLPLLLRAFARPATVKAAAERMEVQEKQLKDWIDRAVAGGYLVKVKERPLEFVSTSARGGGGPDGTRQVNLFGPRARN